MKTYDQNMLDAMRARDERILRERQNIAPISLGFTPETLKQAMADAKAVRRQALRNAKKALEEAFGKRYEEMFAEKLKQEGYERDSERDPEDLRR